MSAARTVAAIVLVCLAAAVPARTSAAAEVRVSIGDRLDPADVTVPVGGSVTWTNDDDRRHRVRSRDATEFDSGNLEPGESYTFVFEVPGSYGYVDARDRDDPAYHGTVTVTDDGGGAEGPSPAGGSPPSEDGAAGTGATATGAGSSPTVAILDRSFSPRSLTVADGSTVVWTNESERDHTVTFDAGGGSGELVPGARYRHTFSEPGTFSYLCAFHPEMTATVTVTADRGPAPAPGGDAAPDAGRSAPSDDPGAADGDPRPVATPAAGGAEVQIVDLAFTPPEITVEEGAEVAWTNAGAAPHTVTGADFDSGVLAAGDGYRRRFPTAGTYDYRCTLHPQMVGTVVVTSAAGGAGRATGSAGGGDEGSGSTAAPATGPPTAVANGDAARRRTAAAALTGAPGTRLGWLLWFVIGLGTGAGGAVALARWRATGRGGWPPVSRATRRP